jgi:hypothetical protein
MRDSEPFTVEIATSGNITALKQVIWEQCEFDVKFTAVLRLNDPVFQLVIMLMLQGSDS